MPIAGATRSGESSLQTARSSARPAAATRARRHELLGEDHVEHREEQRRVAAGADEVVARAPRGRLGAARVDEDDLARRARGSPRSARARSPRPIMAAVRRRGVRAEHEQVLDALEVRHGHREGVAVHLHAGEEARVRVLRVRVEAVSRPERHREELRAERAAVRVDRRVADVERDRVFAVARADRAELLADDVHRLVPAKRRASPAPCAHSRRAQPVAGPRRARAAPCALGHT